MTCKQIYKWIRNLTHPYHFVRRTSNRWTWPPRSWKWPARSSTLPRNSHHSRLSPSPSSRRAPRRDTPPWRPRAGSCWTASARAGQNTRSTGCRSWPVRPRTRARSRRRAATSPSTGNRSHRRSSVRSPGCSLSSLQRANAWRSIAPSTAEHSVVELV